MTRAGRKGNNTGAATPSRAAARPRSVVEAYASVFEDKKEKRRREEAEGLVEDFARCAEQQGCPYCDLLGEAHLHGATLYENGRALF